MELPAVPPGCVPQTHAPTAASCHSKRVAPLPPPLAGAPHPSATHPLYCQSAQRCVAHTEHADVLDSRVIEPDAPYGEITCTAMDPGGGGSTANSAPAGRYSPIRQPPQVFGTW